MAARTIPAGSTVLVTGVNSYIAGHVADQLLALNYKVRGSVRDVSKAADLKAHFDKTYGTDKFELVKVEDIVAETAFVEAARGVSGIVHLASPMYFGNDPNQGIPIGVGGTVSALRGAAANPSVKRVVVTSSVAAVDRTEPGLIGPDRWNELAIKSAWSGSPAPGAVYGATKTSAEKAAWEFVAKEKPSFVLNTVLPGFCFGPAVVGEPSSSGAYPGLVIKGDYDHVRAFGDPSIFVDVRDAAAVHVAALISPTATGTRYFATTSKYTWKQLAELAHRLLPASNVPVEGWSDNINGNQDYDNGPAGTLIKAVGRESWISLEQTIKETYVK